VTNDPAPSSIQAEVVREGSDLTLLGWGAQVGRLEAAADRAAADQSIAGGGLSCEVIDLQTIAPWDLEAVCASVEKTGRLVIAHEAALTCGFGAEIAAKVQERCFLNLEAPIQRVTGWDTHYPLAWDQFMVPSVARLHESIKHVMAY
jgi:2-oxoisovalerate dehydrogenase E1 component beta subunit